MNISRMQFLTLRTESLAY